MGQRTQVLLIAKNYDGSTVTRFYHNQWGIGSEMFNTALSLIGRLNEANRYDDIRISDILKIDERTTNYEDITAKVERELSMNEQQPSIWATFRAKQLKAAQSGKLEDIRPLFEKSDNNNGGMVIIAEHRQDCTLDISLGFLLGDEDTCTPFERFVSPEVYWDIVNGEIEDDEHKDVKVGMIKFLNFWFDIDKYSRNI